ncbi:MAG: Valine-tRNA ligase [candidate division TM6 bacterium GW2011_GWF2_37_49]|nr:MAG: Valine-tRNA ligase [candidate division TM6 bacterium GW2011_GWF2_37_49]
MEMDKIYEHSTSEQKARDLWEKDLIYNFKPDTSKKVFSIDTPPPTVSGSLHVGHVFSYTHQDLIARFKRMRGFNVFYPQGFDDNGLATERFVEKKNGIKGHLMKRSEFIALCLKDTEAVEKNFEDLYKKLGLSIDWTKIYSTISPKVRKISQYSFIELYQKGLAYRKQEPSMFCTTCRTSVAQAELDDAEISNTFNDIQFTTTDGQQLVIATTRPELLPACVAVFYHQDDARYQNLAGKNAIVPIFGHQVPILADEKVSPEKGSGLVMCCTFGDQTDIHWYKKHKLPFVQVVGNDGKWTEKSGPLAGLTVHDARNKMLELMNNDGLLLNQKAISHAVSVHERCKQEIEYLAPWQWFINILDHKEALLQQADKINWHPEHMKVRYHDWVKNLNWDWCVSRQRFFGIPFPVWHCQDCGQILLADEKHLPVDPQEQAFPGGKCTKCGSTNIAPETDIMDTWNTSGLTPQINMNWPGKSPDNITLPMSMRPQAHDIIRTWAFYTIAKAYFHHNQIPWIDIVMSGHVLAGKEKISKSKENSKTSPEALLQTYPADVIRYWAANGKLGTDTAFSENQFKIGHRLLTKLWNAFKFCSEQLGDYKKPASTPKLDALNEWVLHNFSQTMQQYIEAYDKFEYHSALEVAEKFFWQTFCNNYLEIVKDRFFSPEKYSAEEIEATKFVLYELGFGILQLFAPITPYITETLYQMFYQESEQVKSLHLTSMDEKRFNYNFAASNDVINSMLEVIASVRKLKSEAQLSLKTEISTLLIYSQDQNKLNALQKQQKVIAGITKALNIEFKNEILEQPSLINENEVLTAKISVL